MAPQKPEYYAAQMKNCHGCYSQLKFNDAFGFTAAEGAAFTAFLRSEMEKLDILSADTNQNTLASTQIFIITDQAFGDSRWSLRMQAVSVVKSEFVYWSVGKMARNIVRAHTEILRMIGDRASTTATSEASQENRDSGYARDERPAQNRRRKTNKAATPSISDGRLPPSLPLPPPPAFSEATTAILASDHSSLPSPLLSLPPLPNFANDTLWVKHLDQGFSLIRVERFLGLGTVTIPRSSIRPCHASFELFLQIISESISSPYLAGIHQVHCIIHKRTVRMDRTAVEFEGALAGLLNQRTEHMPIMEAFLTLAPGMYQLYN